MSTDRKRKRRFPHIERVKIIEYGLIVLVVLAFVGLAIWYGTGQSPQAPEPTPDPTDTPLPTEDSSIRGMNVLNALEKAGFLVTYREADLYDVHSPDGIALTMQMRSDDRGIKTLSFETVLCPDPEEDTRSAQYARELNKRTVDAVRSLFDSIMPVFRSTAANSDTIAKQCRKVVKDFEPYSKHLTKYSVRITSDAEKVPQTVLITLIRDS